MKVLRLIVNNGSIRGFELKRYSGLTYDALITAAKPLVDRRLVTASGSFADEESIDGVRFAPLSSSL